MKTNNRFFNFLRQKSNESLIISASRKGSLKHVENASTTSAFHSSYNKIGILLLKFRNAFASACEKSPLNYAVNRLYYAFLGNSCKAIATFFLFFSITCAGLNFYNSPDVSTFLSDENFIVYLAMLIVSFLLFCSNRTIGDAVTNSVLISKLDIINKNDLNFKKSNKTVSFSVYSIAFLLGVLAGIGGFISNAFSIALFITSIMFCVFIFNRPECGILVSIPLILFSNTHILLFFITISFAALLYKFLIGKRHISFGLFELILLICALLFMLSGKFNVTGTVSTNDYLKLILLIMFCITVINLIRSTSVLKLAVKLLCDCCGVVSFIGAVYYISKTFFDSRILLIIEESAFFGPIIRAVTNPHFIVPFIVLYSPIALSMFVAEKGAFKKISGILQIASILICVVFAFNYKISLCIVFSIITLSVMKKPKFAFAYILAPAFSFGFTKLYDFVTGKIHFTPIIEQTTFNKTLFDACIEVFKSNFVFGIGIGKENFKEVISNTPNNAYSNVTNADSLVLHALMCLGIFGVIVTALIFCYVLIRSARFIFTNSSKDKYFHTISVSLFTSSASFIILSIIDYTFYDFRVCSLFVLIISLLYSVKRCYFADFIDNGFVREYR